VEVLLGELVLEFEVELEDERLHYVQEFVLGGGSLLEGGTLGEHHEVE